MRHMVLAVLLLGGCATDFDVEPTGPWTDFFNEPRSEDVPKDVRVFVIKSQGCGHFSGEQGYDAQRKAFLKKNIDELCTGLEQKRKALKKKYAGDAVVETVIDQVWNEDRFM